MRPKAITAICVAGGVALTAFAIGAAPMSAPQKWEYRFEQVSWPDDAAANKDGADGWELVTVIYRPNLSGEPICYQCFKRPK